MAKQSLIRAVEPLTDSGKTQLATILEVDVQFDASANTITLSGSGVIGGVIPVGQGLTKMIFRLTTVNGEPGVPQAVFASAPILWLDAQSKLPRTVPAAISPVWIDAQTLEVWDFNQDKSPTSFPFVVVVDYNGNAYFQDPSIVNQPPG